jgi:hypothetical protein
VRPKNGGSERLAWQNLTQQPLVLLAPASVPDENPRGLIGQTDKCLVKFAGSLGRDGEAPS